MSFSLSQKITAASVVIALVLSLIIGLFINHQMTIQRSIDAEKSQVVARQISSRLAYFAQSGELALEEIVRNWPENHPNLEQWFTKLSLSILSILPEFERVWFINHQFQLQWHVPAMAMQSINTIDLDLSELSSDQVSLSKPFLLTDGTQAIAIVKPVIRQDKIYGWVLGVINIEASLSKLVSENLSHSYGFTMVDGENFLYQHGTLENAKHIVAHQIQFVDRSLGIELGLKSTSKVQSNYVIIGIFTVFFLMLLCRMALSNWFKALYSHRQFKAASDASLDGLLIFTQIDDEYQLKELNAVAKDMLMLEQYPCHNFNQLLALLGVNHQELASTALVQLAQGLCFDRSIAVKTHNPALTYIKLQVVKTHNGIAVTVRDISLRKQAEYDLKDREAKYRRLVEGLHGYFLYSTNAKGEPDFVSAAITSILGYQTFEFIEQYRQIFPPTKLNSQRNEVLKELQKGLIPEPYLLECKNVDGDIRLLEFTESPVMIDNKLTKIEGIAKDVTEDKALVDKVTFQAEHDFLTGLYNRYAFDDLLKDAVNQVERHQTDVTLSYIDLDQFKVVNDTCGHIAGDELLKQLGQLITDNINEQHLVARLGGDEFGIIFVDCNIDETKQALKQLLKKMNDFRFVWQDQVFQISASVGVTVVNALTSAQELMKQADVACYAAKDAGRNRINVYSVQDSELNHLEAGIGWVSRIQQALDENRFALYVQKIEAIGQHAREGLHYEVLLRMLDHDGELVSPAQFIPAAERFNLMTAIDKWVVKHVLGQLKHSPELLERTKKCAINLSGTSIIDESFAEEIIEQLTFLNIPADKICFELTETAVITKLSHANVFIEKLRNFGCNFALDDFGVGMCSFAYLKNLPVDIIKIDGSFVKNICHDGENKAIVSAINDIAKALGKKTVAEFVGDQATKNLLADIGINYAQGYAIAKPVPLIDIKDDFTEHLNQDINVA